MNGSKLTRLDVSVANIPLSSRSRMSSRVMEASVSAMDAALSHLRSPVKILTEDDRKGVRKHWKAEVDNDFPAQGRNWTLTRSTRRARRTTKLARSIGHGIIDHWSLKNTPYPLLNQQQGIDTTKYDPLFHLVAESIIFIDSLLRRFQFFLDEAPNMRVKLLVRAKHINSISTVYWQGKNRGGRWMIDVPDCRIIFDWLNRSG